ncbi:hypothetical protein Ddye_030990 [Dipteronia dyeriana]|uniref:non-specific serine/threonine protein kinase n=1 Tax=Dipteronia dyeriana TaxID=168575 RepID=A0AAD9WN83_9ROSI|nr:hypothetical protein Ddye_030990 [Dipteronia dyeriana]
MPEQIFNMPRLSISLNLAQNHLVGSIPPNIGNLKVLTEFDVSNNNLSGEIPNEIGLCSNFEYLYMEDTLFNGSIPPSLSSLRGIQQLDLSRNNLSCQISKFLETFPLEKLNLSFTAFEGEVPMEGIFSNASGISVVGNNNRLCGGSFGSVYKGILDKNGDIVAVKRLNIAVDVASAVEYLHHHCQEPILHYDLKPSNILLDNDMIAHIGDFGLARFHLEVQNPNQSSFVGVKGTVGYAALEYGLGNEVSTDGDVYSFGILLLEMVTKKKPTDLMFEGDLNIHSFARMALPDRVIDIVDPMLINEEMITTNHKMSQALNKSREECLISMVRIGVTCSVESPQDRMNISRVFHELQSVRKILLQATSGFNMQRMK